MIDHPLQNRMFCIGHLNQHLTLSIFSSGPAAHLFHQLKCPFIHPEFRKIQQTVRIENTNQVHVIKIQTLHNHLCTHQDINPLLFKLFDQHIVGSFAPHTVHIHPGNMGFGKKIPNSSSIFSVPKFRWINS